MKIRVEVIYALQSCRSRLGCDMGFRLLNYKTNTQEVADITGDGYMNIDNYDEFGRARPSSTRRPYFDTYSFELGSSDTGFYVALRDKGTCVGISRLRVYRYICPARQVALVQYDEIPAPSSGSIEVPFTCVENSYLPESAKRTVQCDSDGVWGDYVPVCKCRLGYEDRGKYCYGKSV